jgi:hypothetical protein
MKKLILLLILLSSCSSEQVPPKRLIMRDSVEGVFFNEIINKSKEVLSCEHRWEVKADFAGQLLILGEQSNRFQENSYNFGQVMYLLRHSSDNDLIENKIHELVFKRVNKTNESRHQILKIIEGNQCLNLKVATYFYDLGNIYGLSHVDQKKFEKGFNSLCKKQFKLKECNKFYQEDFYNKKLILDEDFFNIAKKQLE